MVIRIAEAEDAPKIAYIHVETWRAAYRGQIADAVLDALDVGRGMDMWRGRIKNAHGVIFIAEEKGSITGFCDLIPSRDPDADPQTVAEIVAIYVLPAQWGKGVGRALCDSAVAEARRQGFKAMTLWVLATNQASQLFYQAMGFHADGASKTEKAIGGSDLHEVRFRMEI
jgi:ribosomal protein S18 acetylase RimI-like enzyme